ncbi:13E12 repeat family protein [Mycolicibacterium frederiksbergense]|uniref:13E12 repeat family protein n=1 Tax=Mycolicibacterium frederiksbergense TaxID=117567 RepID=UPI0021F2BA70|nr:13E12 repeat family protein [Mycolicibacterium frederiksbergense]
MEKFDPDAVVRSRRAAKDLYVEFDDKDDPNGVASFWGRLRITDKKILEQRLDALADTVCPNDPRKRGELRAAALAALGAVGPALERLACECGDVNCAGSGKDPRAGAITIYALTDQVPAAGEDIPPQSAPGTAGTPETEPTATEAAPDKEEQTPAASGDEKAPAACNPSPGVMLDGAIIPAAMLAELVAAGATVKPLSEIAALPAERQYRPSTALTAFVRMRA